MNKAADRPPGTTPSAPRRRLFPALTFRGKAVLFLVPTIVAMSLGYTLEAINTENRILKDEIIKKGETVAAVAAKNAELPILSGNAELLQGAAASLKGIRDVSFVAFCDVKFEPLVHEGPPPRGRPPIGRLPGSPGVFRGAPIL